MIYGTEMGGFAPQFFHKPLLRRIGRAAGAFISGGPVAAATALVRSPKRGSQCPAGWLTLPDGRCQPPAAAPRLVQTELVPVPGPIGAAQRFFEGGASGFQEGAPVGAAVMGRYGAALRPGSRIIDRAVCLRGMQLGDDGLCYNKSQITNRQRMWPAGRRPLLTGGDMRAISTAARAGRRLEGATKRLQKIGLMKKPPPRMKRLTSGPTVHHHHE